MVSHLPLICISLIINEAEHPFICLLAICVSLTKLRTSVHQDTVKKVKNKLQSKASYLPHTQLTKIQCEEYRQEGDNSLQRKWAKEMTGISQKILLVITVNYKNVFGSIPAASHRVEISHIKWKLSLAQKQLSKALSLPSSEISQKSLLLSHLPARKII